MFISPNKVTQWSHQKL